MLLMCYSVCYSVCHCARLILVPSSHLQAPEPKSDYEKQRAQRMDDNARMLLLLEKVKIGRCVHIPQSVFPDEVAPPEGYWVGKICLTKKGGMGDVGIHIEGEEVFTRSRLEVAKWLQEEEPSAFAPAEAAPGAAPDVSCERNRNRSHTRLLPRHSHCSSVTLPFTRPRLSGPPGGCPAPFASLPPAPADMRKRLLCNSLCNSPCNSPCNTCVAGGGGGRGGRRGGRGGRGVRSWRRNGSPHT